MMDTETSKEFCRFNLSSCRDGMSSGNIVGYLRRVDEESWSITAKGLFTMETRKPSQMKPFVNQILNNYYENVKYVKYSKLENDVHNAVNNCSNKCDRCFCDTRHEEGYRACLQMGCECVEL